MTAWDWQPIGTLPDTEELVLAHVQEDGRTMVWRASLLRHAISNGTPTHLKFPATHWISIKRPGES